MQMYSVTLNFRYIMHNIHLFVHLFTTLHKDKNAVFKFNFSTKLHRIFLLEVTFLASIKGEVCAERYRAITIGNVRDARRPFSDIFATLRAVWRAVRRSRGALRPSVYDRRLDESCHRVLTECIVSRYTKFRSDRGFVARHWYVL